MSFNSLALQIRVRFDFAYEDNVHQRYVRSVPSVKPTCLGIASEPHPKAATLTHGSMSRSRSDYHFTLSPQSITTARIAGDFVGLLVREVIGQIDTYIEIWNWTKGTTFSHRVCVPSRVIYIALADTCIMIV